MPSAVVFAYHQVGVRCLAVLLAHGIEVALVVSHEDDPGESIWFESVTSLAKLNGIEAIAPANAADPTLAQRIAAIAPDFIFSFYYRSMLPPALLGLARRGAYNMHGSLLPKYRGRAPVNWAVLKGERQTGATLHRMVDKPDAGAVVAQQAVPILPDDRAHEVMAKVTVAAELALDAVLPALISGEVRERPLDLAAGSYFGGRKPEDGRVDWRQPASDIHNLVRAVAPPYPGAFCTLPSGASLRLLRTLRQPRRVAKHPVPTLYCEGEAVLADCADGGVLRLLEWEGDWDRKPVQLSFQLAAA